MKIKNLFWGMLAFAGIITMASCQQDDFVGGETAGDYVDATFTVFTADGISTRADIGDGTTVNKVACEVYDANGDEMKNLSQIRPITDKTATYSVRLAKGQAYRVVFFAYNDEGNYYDVTDLNNIQVIGDLVCNVEARDAFTGVYNVTAEESMNAISTEPIELKRPLAQLNIGIDDEEKLAAKEAGIVISESSVKVSNVYTAFNAYENAVAGNATTLKFEMNEIPKHTFEVEWNGIDGIQEKDEKFTYLALNYLLVGDLNSEKTLTDVEFIWATEDDKTNNPTTSFPNVRTQRNYRTNIIGKLITNPAEFTVKIDDRFEGDKNKIYTDENGIRTAVVSTPAELQQALNEAEKGDNVIRIEDLILSRAATTVPEFTILQQEDVNLTIDGCGKSYEIKFLVNGNARSNGAETLTFRNINFKSEASDFTFINAPSKVDDRYNYSHNVTIEDCTFEANQTVGSASLTGTYNFVMRNCIATNMHSILQLQSCDNNALVDNVKTVNCKNGLSFGNTADPTLKNSNIVATGYGVRADGNASRGNLVIENTTINAIKPVIVRKMTTAYNVNLDNAKLAIADENANKYHVAFTNGEDDKDYVAPTGKFSIKGAEEYEVYPYVKVSTAEELIATLAKGENVIFLNDITVAATKGGYNKAGIIQHKAQSIDGNGHTLTVTGAGATWDCAIYTNGGIIKNLTVAGAMRGIFTAGQNSDLYIDGVEFKNVIYTFNSDGTMPANPFGVYVSNSTVNGWTSHSDMHSEVVYTNCSFGEGSGYKYCRPYGKTEFVNCTFCAGYSIDETKMNVITFTDCTWEE